jgi:hypothetical protein
MYRRRNPDKIIVLLFWHSKHIKIDFSFELGKWKIISFFPVIKRNVKCYKKCSNFFFGKLWIRGSSLIVF